MRTLPPKTSLSSVSKYAIYLMPITRAVLAQSPEPEAHVKSALKTIIITYLGNLATM